MTHSMTPDLRRRGVVRALALGAAGCCGFARAQLAQPIRLGQSAPLSGPLSDLGTAIHQGAQACFASANARGGVSGRPIELITLDDGYDVKRAVANVQGFIADPALFCLYGCVGTPMIEATLPLIRSSGVPCFAPLTGAMSARPADLRNVFNVRASYPDEAARLVRHMATVAHKRIAVVYLNNSFGTELAPQVEAAVREHRLTLATTATVEPNGVGAKEAAKRIAAAAPDVVLVGLSGKATIDFVRAMRAERRGLQLYALSVLGSAAMLGALEEDAHGIVVSQVVPLPSRLIVPVVRDFQQAWTASATRLQPSHIALESYINARVLIEALKRCGSNLTRAKFVESTWGMRLDLGGFEVSFDKPGRNASRFIDLTLVGSGGRFIH